MFDIQDGAGLQKANQLFNAGLIPGSSKYVFFKRSFAVQFQNQDLKKKTIQNQSVHIEQATGISRLPVTLREYDHRRRVSKRHRISLCARKVTIISVRIRIQIHARTRSATGVLTFPVCSWKKERMSVGMRSSHWKETLHPWSSFHPI